MTYGGSATANAAYGSLDVAGIVRQGDATLSGSGDLVGNGTTTLRRDSGWELERLDGSLAGTHEGWILSDDEPINLSDRGEVTANGTYTSPKPRRQTTPNPVLVGMSLWGRAH